MCAVRVKAPKPPPSIIDTGAAEADAAKRARRQRGYAGTFLGGQQGVLSPPNIGAATLLGG